MEDEELATKKPTKFMHKRSQEDSCIKSINDFEK